MAGNYPTRQRHRHHCLRRDQERASFRKDRARVGVGGDGRGACAASGLTNRDIDGLAINLPAAEVGNSFYSNILADNLGIEARWLQLTDIGGCAVLGNVARAAAALKCGMCEIALCLNSDASSRRQQTSVLNYRTEFQDPTGYHGPLIAFGLMTDAYRQKYDFKQEALGQARDGAARGRARQ